MLSPEQRLYRDHHIVEVAYLIGIKPATLERYIREGKYPDVVLPDFMMEDNNED